MTAGRAAWNAALLASILGLAANRAAAESPANAQLASALPAEPGIERSVLEKDSPYPELIKVRHALLARRKAIDARIEAAQKDWADATTEFNRLEPQRRALRMESAQLESIHVIPAGRFTTAQRAQYNRISNQLRELTAQYNELETTGCKALVRRQESLRQQSDARRDLQELGRESDALCRRWLAGLDFLRLRSRAEHEALWSLFSTQLEDDPENVGAILGRGLSAWKLGRVEDAAGDFDRVIELDRVLKLDHGCAASALATRARLECELGKPDAGHADFTKAYKMARTNHRLYLLRGMASAAGRNYPAAQHDFETANRSSDVTSDGFRLLAWLHIAQSTSPADEQAQQAIVDALRACQLTADKDWACLDALAAAQAAAGRFDDAANTAGQAADRALDDNRQKCLEHQRRYRAHKPPQIDWN